MEMTASNLMSSLRSRSGWQSRSGSEIFSLSSRDQDDEEALKWAALEKLPTYDRLRKRILTVSTGEKMEIDIANLGFHERKNLLERLIRVTEEDNEKFLLKLKNRMERWVHQSVCTLCSRKKKSYFWIVLSFQRRDSKSDYWGAVWRFEYQSRSLCGKQWCPYGS